MEKKTTYRILGVLAVIALAISLLPIFVTKSNTSETTIVKAPPFPDEATQVPAVTAEDDQQTPLAMQPINANPSPENQSSVQAQPNSDASKSADKTPSEEPKDLFSVNRPSIVSDNIVEPENSKESNSSPLTISDNDPENSTLQTDTPSSKISHIKKSKHQDKTIPTLKANLHEPDTAELKKAVWVIQMGSFKSKTNALKLVNRLRANGYHAFIKKSSGLLGENTRVFVGPEKKKSNAHALASRLNNDVHIKGIVLSYKPLEL